MKSKLYKVKQSKTNQKFQTGAVRDSQEGKGRFDLLPIDAIEALAKHFEAGAVRYGDDNWLKGIPLKRYLDSALRHLFKELRGDSDEPHAIACAWNMLAYWQTKKLIEDGKLPKELNNMPTIYKRADNGKI